MITGVVRNGTTGVGIPNARVFFYGTAYGTVFTDATGTYSFSLSNLTLFGGAISGTLYAGATGYFEAAAVPISDLSAQPTLPVVRDILLRPGGAVIRGVVRDASTGQGISGATISFTRSPMSTFLGGATEQLVQSAADGSYVIDSSSFNESGLTSGFSANLQVNASGYLGASRPVSFATYPSIQDFALRSTSGPLITGVVRDRTTGAGIPNARIFFYGTAYGTVFADSTGAYAINGAQLTLFGGSISGTLYAGVTGYFEAAPVPISNLSAEPTLPVVRDILLRPGGAVIRGVVRDASTGQGISGATISFTRSPMSTFLGGATEQAVQSAADGSYTIDSSSFNESGLTSGFSANLQVNANGYQGATRPVSFSAYPSIQDFALRSTSGPLITGVVRDRATGAGIPNARIFFYGTAYGTVFTDSTGAYAISANQLNVFGGSISGTLYAGATGYFEAAPVPISNLSAQPTLPVVRDILLRPGGAVIRGVVRDASTGQGISGATISFTRSPMSTFLGGATEQAVQSAADGSYAIDSSSFNESGLTSGFSASLHVNATNYLGATRPVSFAGYPSIQDFSLVSVLNRPPLANAGPDQTVSAGLDCRATITLDGTLSSDPDHDVLAYRWTGAFGSATGASATIILPVGTHTITLTVTDGAINAADSLVVTVRDGTPPATVAAWASPNTSGWYTNAVVVSMTASDACSSVREVRYSSSGGQTSSSVAVGNTASLAVTADGITTVTYYAVDQAGNQEAPRSLSIQIDRTPPTMACRVTPDVLWAPDHKMVPVAAFVTVTDSASGPSGFLLTSVTSSDADSGVGSGDLPNDIQGFDLLTPDTNGRLRAERFGRVGGRIYTLAFRGTDVAGNSATCTVTVAVPHDQKR